MAERNTRTLLILLSKKTSTFQINSNFMEYFFPLLVLFFIYFLYLVPVISLDYKNLK